jgi:hypothetical protein
MSAPSGTKAVSLKLSDRSRWRVRLNCGSVSLPLGEQFFMGRREGHVTNLIARTRVT